MTNSTNKTNTPPLRFPEFQGDWEKKKLGEVAEITTGSTPSTAVEEYYNGNKLFVSPADLNGNRFIRKTRTTLSELGFSKGRRIKKGSVLFVCIGSTIGKVGIANEDCLTNQQINALSSKDDFENNFIYTLLEKNGSEIKLLAGVQAVPQINKSDFSNLSFSFPSLPEQTKIASFLTAVDEKIQALKKKHRLLEQYKKGVMQRLFCLNHDLPDCHDEHDLDATQQKNQGNQGNHKKSRFRQKDGSDFPEWERKKGGALFESISNKNHNSNLPILAITQEFGAIPRDMIEYQISVTDKSVESYKVVEIGDFIISLRSFQGGIEYSNYKGICSPAYVILRNTQLINKAFFKYYFKTDFYIQRLCEKLEGIRDGKMISYKYFSEIELPYPSIAEQTLIANFLSSIDEKINQTQSQIEKTEVWKKGLLQKMFV